MQISFFNKINTYNNIFKRNQEYPINNRYPNLAPLPKDTVSFTGSAELISEYMAYAPSGNLCKKLEDAAIPAQKYLEFILDKYLNPITKDDGNKKTNSMPVLAHPTRVKSALSIKEKVVSKFTKSYDEYNSKVRDAVLKELFKFFKINPAHSKEDVIKTVNEYLTPQNTYLTFKNPKNVISDIVSVTKNLNLLNYDDYSKEAVEKKLNAIETIISSIYPIPILPNPSTSEGIKFFANDIVGGRIILNKTDKKNTAKVISALKSAVKDGYLNITSIENNIPDTKKIPKNKSLSDFDYISEDDLKSLAKQANAELITNKSHSGYIAIHINVDLSNAIFSKYNDKFNGYSGEIQIMGPDIETLKEVEDICYKLKDSKNAISSRYKEFKEHFDKYYKDAKQAFQDYTYNLYLFQRMLPDHKSQLNQSFPSIKDMGYEGKVPAELDYNLLREIKNRCDREYKQNNPPQPKKITPTMKNLIHELESYVKK